MFIETTININKNDLQKITDVATAFNISKSKLVSLLLIEMLQNKPGNSKLFQTVTYQKRLAKNNWHTLHISLRCDFYEKGLDLRKVFKLSVSFICSIAIAKFLDKIIHKLKNNTITDNYPFQYVFIPVIDEKLYSYTVYLEKPKMENTKKE